MWPPVPPPAITVPRRALTDLGPSGPAGGPTRRSAASRTASPWRATLTRMPAAAIVMTSDDPPKEMNGSGIPVTGSTPTTAPTLMRVSAPTQATSPRASSAPKRSGDCVAARMPEPHEAAEEREHQDGTDDAELLADDREDEVGVRVGQEAPLRLPAAEAGADEVARSQPDERLHDLVARARAVGRWIHERQQPGPAVGRGHRHDQGQPDQGGHHLHDRPEPHARDEQQGQRDEAEDHGRAHVRLGQDQDAGEAGDEEQRADDAAVGGVLIEAAGDEVGCEEREGQLHQLGRLQAELPEADPAARPHGVHAEAGDEDDEQQPEGHQQEQGAEPPQLAVVDAQRQPEHHQRRSPSTSTSRIRIAQGVP